MSAFRAEGRSTGVIEHSMDLWEHVEDAVHDVSEDLPSDEAWLPSEVVVDVSIETVGRGEAK